MVLQVRDWGYAELVTEAEAYELTTRGGATDFARIIRVCESTAPYCLIGGLAVNCYVDPVYTLDADFVVVSAALPGLASHLEEDGFKTEVHPHPAGFRLSSGAYVAIR